MAEAFYDGVGGCEGQTAGDEADGVDGVPVGYGGQRGPTGERERVYGPDAYELDVHVGAEGALEGDGELPSPFAGRCVHFVRERDLLDVSGGEEADL